ncbi:helix-turn-helix domain-containing protein [Roseateles agri]|uniref:helix-turn-helix domain-containing protein n=1 Tax=Roseateles agri TaxID=3098619 RepID=UPI003D665AC7
MNTINQSTAEELITRLGEDVKRLRLDQNISQLELAKQAGISRKALVNLETGVGATLNTLVRALRVLGREAWLATLAPQVSVSPIDLMKLGHRRQRASGDRTSTAPIAPRKPKAT